MDPDPASFLLLLSSLLASAFFSGMEIAYVSANRLQAELDRKQGGLAGRIVEFLLRRQERFIATMLVGNNLALVVFGLESGKLLGQWLFGVPEWEQAPSPLLALSVQTAIATVVILITAEFLPKSLFHGAPNRWLRALSIPLVIVHTLLLPPALVVLALSRLFLGKRQDDGSADTLGAVDLDHFVRSLNERIEGKKRKRPSTTSCRFCRMRLTSPPSRRAIVWFRATRSWPSTPRRPWTNSSGVSPKPA